MKNISKKINESLYDVKNESDTNITPNIRFNCGDKLHGKIRHTIWRNLTTNILGPINRVNHPTS